MKKKLVSVILAGSMLLSLASCDMIWPSDPTESKPETESTEVTEPSETEPSIMGFNMINNGDFASKDHEWHTYFEGGDRLIMSTGQMMFNVMERLDKRLFFAVEIKNFPKHLIL